MSCVWIRDVFDEQSRPIFAGMLNYLVYRMGVNITITLILRALLSFEARLFSFAARRFIYARREAEGINESEGCKWKNKGFKWQQCPKKKRYYYYYSLLTHPPQFLFCRGNHIFKVINKGNFLPKGGTSFLSFLKGSGLIFPGFLMGG